MKLRISGNSIRLRVSRSEVHRFYETGRIEETIHFGLDPGTKLTYALEHAELPQEIALHYKAQEIVVVLSSESARRWADSPEQVGLYGRIDVCSGELALLVEKDFACLDGRDDDNEDTFPNPNTGATC
jgi:hypothetical protein